MTNYRQTMAETLEFMYLMREYKLAERELTDAEKKKREEIAQDMDDADFKDRYGDRWKEVKMAVATKAAKGEKMEGFDLYEAEADYTIVAIKNNKVVDQQHSIAKSEFKVAIKLFKKNNPGAKISIEDKGGKIVHTEDLDEGGVKDLVIKGQDLEAYAKKSGGIDKADLLKVAVMLKKGDKSGALKYTKKLDTDPRDYILNLLGEEVELDEVFWKVNIPEMPPIFIEASSKSEIKVDMRKKLKSDVYKELSIDKVSKSEMIKTYRKLIKGEDGEDEVKEDVELDEVLKPGAKVKVPHKGKMVQGKVVRYDKGGRGESPFYVVDVG